MQDCRELIQLLKDQKVHIQTHNFPDPDAISSAYGLQQLLGHFGINATLCYKGKIDKLSTLKMTEMFEIDIFSYEDVSDNMQEEDYIVCVDSQKNGGNISRFNGNVVACIDHHPTINDYSYQYCDVRLVGSCATLIAKYFYDLKIAPDTNTATALLYGLKMDTLQMNRGVTPLDVEMFGFLYPLADLDLLNKVSSSNLETNDLKAYGAAIENIRICGKVGFASIPFSCADALVAIISEFILELSEVTVSVVYSFREDGIKFSIRSDDPKIDAGKVINEALKDWGNAGGHKTMAGGLIKFDSINDLGVHIERSIQNRIMEVIEMQKAAE